MINISAIKCARLALARALCVCFIVAAAGAFTIRSAGAENQPAQGRSDDKTSAQQETTSNPERESSSNAIERRNLLDYSVDIDPNLYIVNSGDIFSIRIWKPGLESSEYKAMVINGKIFLEMIGEIDIAGLTLRQATGNITKHYAERFSQFKVYVTLSSMRVFFVLVAGQVQTPGFYKINPMTSLTDAIALAGGITPITGSIRAVRITGSDGTSDTFDLFRFGDAGDTNQNPLLKEKDSVFIPVRFGSVEVKGDVLKPGKCEIVDGDALFSLKDCFKDIAPQANRGKLLLKRPTASAVTGDASYSINTFTWDDLNGETGKKLALRDGDILEVGGIVEKEFVIINGQVKLPGQYLYMKNMRVTDLLNEAGGLEIVAPKEAAPADTQVTNRLNTDVSISGAYKLLINRVNRQTGQIDNILLNLTDLLVRGDGSQNIELMPGDVLSVTANLDVVYVYGMVTQPGFFPYDPNNTVRDFIFVAGGPNKDADIGRAKLTRNGVTLHVNINDMPKPGDTIYVPASAKFKLRDNLSFIGNLFSVYLMIDRISN
jgi:polysaccharide biosynthesis/export protein